MGVRYFLVCSSVYIDVFSFMSACWLAAINNRFYVFIIIVDIVIVMIILV